jgi:hypothetical protein
MQRKTTLVVVVVIALLVTVALLGLAATNFRPLTSELSTVDRVGAPATQPAVDFMDGDNMMATATVESLTELEDGVWLVRANIAHGPGTQLRSARLAFDLGEPFPRFAMEPPGGYPWEPIEFHRGPDGSQAIIDFPDLGFQGRGSLTLEFLLGPTADPPETIEVELTITIERDFALALTRHSGQAQLTVAVSD